MFKGFLNGAHEAQRNVIRKLAILRIGTAKAKGIEQNTARVALTCKRKF